MPDPNQQDSAHQDSAQGNRAPQEASPAAVRDSAASTLADTEPGDMPLRYLTPASWAKDVLSDPLALLNDHAHLEKKAAANALDMIHRFPEGDQFKSYRQRWVQTLAAIARDESEHLGQVLRVLESRGGSLSKKHRNTYAAALRKLVRLGDGPLESIDRLMVCALIEIRSCERFGALAASGTDGELVKLYSDLYGSELGHYKVFIELAYGMPNAPADEDIEARWSYWLDKEAAIIKSQPIGPTVHSGVGEDQ
jgi:tRNA-(ms[2]io[6]A)-hydroxylase